uniref:Wsv526 n=1 Tax=Caenorhabditis tropicalis TaxID=1561998 RepID=A0A1I7TEU4_9PELO
MSIPSSMTSSITSITSDSSEDTSSIQNPKKILPGSGRNVFCPVSNLTLFHIENSFSVFHFDPRSKRPVKHNCIECVPQVKEEELNPLYAVKDTDSDEYVIFMKNKISKKIQQFVLTESGAFREVDRPDIEFNPMIRSSPFFTIHFGREQVVIQKDEQSKTWKKMRFGMEREEIGPLPIETLMIQEMRKEESIGGIHGSIPYYQIIFCSHNQKSILKIHSDGVLKNFSIDEKSEEFIEVEDCISCLNQITENDLIPKYTEYHQPTGNIIIHVRNTASRKFEKYIFNAITGGFEEVDYPDVVYDRHHDSFSPVVLTVKSPVYEGNFVIHRNWQGRIIKHLMTTHGNFLINPYKVTTLQRD